MPISTYYAADSGATIYGGRSAAPASNLVAIFGDSNSALSYDSLHPFTWLIALCGGVMKLVANSSVAGNTVANGLDRVNNSYTHVSPGLAGLPPLGAVALALGTNNTRGGTSITPTEQAQYAELITALLVYGTYVFVMAVPPVGAPESGAGVNSFNAWLASYCAGNPRLKFIDHCDTVNDGTGDWVEAFRPGDGIHLSDAASCEMGHRAAVKAGPTIASFGFPSPISTDPLNVYPAHPQWVVNPLMAGSGGENTLGTGAVANNWKVGGYGGGFAGTAAKIASTDSNPTPWQSISPSQITFGEGGLITIGATLAGAEITTSYPDALDLVFEIKFAGFAASKFRYLKAYIYGNSNEELSPPMYLRMGIGTLNETAVMRGALRRAGTRVAHASAVLSMSLAPAVSFTGAMGSIQFRCMTTTDL